MASAASASDYLLSGDAILVGPLVLFDLSNAISATGKSLLGAAASAMTAVQGLGETWISGSATEAQDFARRLADDLIDLFGTGDASSPGALAAYAEFLKATAGAFDATETNLQATWLKFTKSLLSTSSDGASSVSSDPDDTAITYS